MDFNSNNDFLNIVNKKINYFQKLLINNNIYIQNNKNKDILTISEYNNAINILLEINEKIINLNNKIKIENYNNDEIVNYLQNINNDFSSIFKNYGTYNLQDLFIITCGNKINYNKFNEEEKKLLDLLFIYFHPLSYKVNKNDTINFKISEIETKNKNFFIKVYGIEINILINNKVLIIGGILDDIILDLLNNEYIIQRNSELHKNKPNDNIFENKLFDNFIKSLNLKDYIINNNEELYNKFVGIRSNLNCYNNKTLLEIVKDFNNSDLFNKRTILITLLLEQEKIDNQYLAYLLYDLLSSENNNNVDSNEQIMLFDSFSFYTKKFFHNTMTKTNEYTNELINFDNNKIPLEQQICLLKASESTKEKAMQKLKEIKSKSEDSGFKARQYLDGLLKIPFNIYKKEPILYIKDNIKTKFKEIIDFCNNNYLNNITNNLEIKDTYTNLEIINNIKLIKEKYNELNNYNFLYDLNKNEISNIIKNINKFFKKYKKNKEKKESKESKEKESKEKESKEKENNEDKLNKQFEEKIIQNNFKNLLISNKSKKELLDILISILEINKNNIDFINLLNSEIFYNYRKYDKLLNFINNIENDFSIIKEYISNIKINLDNAIYGHDKAKKQIQRIIGQWINGKQDGYCFGFEGPPGVGKTSLAKIGLANCLKDENNISRPFAMIQIGGDSNGSSLHGHNYTYVGSTWGSIVQILIDKKIMNPIIFIDEVDKISKTEHGKEIIGILTHLLDPTQNDCFQDKYFSGIDLDLSKVLFILSYNDPESIDKILLDRVHIIKFQNLNINEKIIIAKKYLLPEIYSKMGLENMIKIDDIIIKFIIDEYTCESGVRKLKEILFEIISEINLNILNNIYDYSIPIYVSKEDIINKYCNNKKIIKNKLIHNENKVGIISGLWANSLGYGGIVPIECKWRPGSKFLDLFLTGMQGDVMKESMNVALTLAWNLTNENIKNNLLNDEKFNNNGIHIHCPENSVHKDGPSAGTAITCALFSLINNIKIKNNIAITGEITLDGKITEIGGINMKILGGIKAGVDTFILPKENQKDFDEFIEKYKEEINNYNIKFYLLSNIEEVFEYVFEI